MYIYIYICIYVYIYIYIYIYIHIHIHTATPSRTVAVTYVTHVTAYNDLQQHIDHCSSGRTSTTRDPRTTRPPRKLVYMNSQLI